MEDYRYSPSQCHELVSSQTTQELAYDTTTNTERWRRMLRKKLCEILGDLPRDRTALECQTHWIKSNELGTIEKLTYRSEPGADIPAYLCTPRNGTAPCPLFICLQGHTSGMHNSIGLDFKNESRAIKVAGDRDFVLACLKRGVAAFCIEGRGFGYLKETKRQVNPYFNHVMERRKDSCYDAAMQALVVGRTLAGERLYDVDRGIDFLQTRDELDKTRIGIMGMSAGGMITIYAMALLDRIQFAMPAGHYCSFAESLLSKHHCGCCYVPGIYKYADMSDIAGLFAPKPVVVVTGKKDPSKPIDAVIRSFNKLKKIYEDAGAGDNCRLVIGDEGHRFYAEPAWREMLDFVVR